MSKYLYLVLRDVVYNQLLSFRKGKYMQKSSKKYLTDDVRKLVVDRMMRGEARNVDIAKEYGLSPQHVNTIILRHELKTGKRRASKKK